MDDLAGHVSGKTIRVLQGMLQVDFATFLARPEILRSFRIELRA
jgi:hypothetical protein